MFNPFVEAIKYAERERTHVQTSIVNDQLVLLIKEAYIAGYNTGYSTGYSTGYNTGYSAYIQDMPRERDERYERVDL